jgi:hypothetical protein
MMTVMGTAAAGDLVADQVANETVPGTTRATGTPDPKTQAADNGCCSTSDQPGDLHHEPPFGSLSTDVAAETYSGFCLQRIQDRRRRASSK